MCDLASHLQAVVNSNQHLENLLGGGLNLVEMNLLHHGFNVTSMTFTVIAQGGIHY